MVYLLGVCYYLYYGLLNVVLLFYVLLVNCLVIEVDVVCLVCYLEFDEVSFDGLLVWIFELCVCIGILVNFVVFGLDGEDV